jgi:DNA-binding NarL/FixJ family response regulator
MIEDLLTPRERAVLALLCRGLTRAQAAAALGLAPSTVVRHVNLILAATDLHTMRDVCRALEREPERPDRD